MDFYTYMENFKLQSAQNAYSMNNKYLQSNYIYIYNYTFDIFTINIKNK